MMEDGRSVTSVDREEKGISTRLTVAVMCWLNELCIGMGGGKGGGGGGGGGGETKRGIHQVWRNSSSTGMYAKESGRKSFTVLCNGIVTLGGEVWYVLDAQGKSKKRDVHAGRQQEST